MLDTENQDPNTRNCYNETSLHLVARSGDVSIAKIFLRRGADPNAVDEDAWTPLLLALERGWKEMVETLLAYGGDPNIVDTKYSKNGYEMAVHFGWRFLYPVLAPHMNRTAVDLFGRTVLHRVVLNDSAAAVELMKVGFDPHLPDMYLETPHSLALRRRDRMAEFLEISEKLPRHELVVTQAARDIYERYFRNSSVVFFGQAPYTARARFYGGEVVLFPGIYADELETLRAQERGLSGLPENYLRLTMDPAHTMVEVMCFECGRGPEDFVGAGFYPSVLEPGPYAVPCLIKDDTERSALYRYTPENLQQIEPLVIRFRVDREAALRALAMIERVRADCQGHRLTYQFWFMNCVSFPQMVYRAAGLPGHLAEWFTVEQLLHKGNNAGSQALMAGLGWKRMMVYMWGDGWKLQDISFVPWWLDEAIKYGFPLYLAILIGSFCLCNLPKRRVSINRCGKKTY
jgi:hypothetical protein